MTYLMPVSAHETGWFVPEVLHSTLTTSDPINEPEINPDELLKIVISGLALASKTNS